MVRSHRSRQPVRVTPPLRALRIPLAAGVLYPVFAWRLSPMIAAAAMAASSLSVVTNANRLRRFHPPTSDASAPSPLVAATVEVRRTEVDPVCGMTVTVGPSAPTLTYAGRQVWFCSPGCRDAFAADPDAHLHQQPTGGAHR